MVLDDHEIGRALADERAQYDMSQETLAAEMRRHGAPHMTRGKLGRVEAGQRKLSARELGAAALALCINPSKIIMPGAKVRPLDPRIETAEMAEAVRDEIHLVETIARLLAKMVTSPSEAFTEGPSAGPGPSAGGNVALGGSGPRGKRAPAEAEPTRGRTHHPDGRRDRRRRGVI